jgi:hypothetical protein
MDQGAMMRYLSEMIWFPTAFLGDNVSFEPVDDRSARVTLTDGGRAASATMVFDEIGKLVDFVAERYRTVDGGFASPCGRPTCSFPARYSVGRRDELLAAAAWSRLGEDQ